MDLFFRARRVQHPHAVRLGAGDGEKSFADALVKRHGLRLKMIGGGGLTPTVEGTLKSFSHGQIHQKSHNRKVSITGKHIQLLKERLVKSPAVPLIGGGRVNKAVGDDDFVRGQTGGDNFLYVLGTVCEHHQQLGAWGQGRFGRVEEHLSQDLASRCSAGLTRDDDLMTLRTHGVGQERDLGALAAALDTFKGEENTRHVRNIPDRVSLQQS